MNQRQILWTVGIALATIWATNNIAFIGNITGPTSS